MKRSQMLDILQNFFQYDCAFESPHDARISADRILTIIESEGMLPPFSGKFKQENIVDRWGKDTKLQQIVRVMVNEWEPEEPVDEFGYPILGVFGKEDE